MDTTDGAIDDTLGQDLLHLNSFSEQQLLEVSEITLQFLVDSKVILLNIPNLRNTGSRVQNFKPN